MTCKTCGSANVSNFEAEIAIHFPGLKNIDVPPVFVFPSLLVCFDCGAAQFAVPEREVGALQKRKAAGTR
jgi:hypothetical protein